MAYPTDFSINDTNRPVTFKLPDNDEVNLIPWEYVIDRLSVDLAPSLTAITKANDALETIDTRLGELMNSDE